MKIYGKKWYYGLKKSKEHEYKFNLLDEYKLNDVAKHLIVCLEPDKLPGQYEPARTKKGKMYRYYTLFDSYLDFYTYMLKFPIEDRNFFEVILGDLPQKPHFDIDIDQKDVIDGSIEDIGSILYQSVIQYSIEVLKDISVSINIETDILIYISHGKDKRSYHIIINNKCHDGNEEAKAFYQTVIDKITEAFNINNKEYVKYIKFIDNSVYSKKQQFRIMGCQKYSSNRPKRFLERFKYNNIEYKHKYVESFANDDLKKLAILYESLITFVSGCSYIQSLVKPKIYHNYNNYNNNYLDDVTINRCMKMLKEKMDYCPFSISSIDDEKRTIYLKREAPSHCPICNKREPHESRDPLIYINKGRVYWNCLRHEKGIPNLYLGDLSMNILELQNFFMNNKDNTDETIIESNNEYFDDEIECYKIPEKSLISLNKSEKSEEPIPSIILQSTESIILQSTQTNKNETINSFNLTQNINELLLKTVKESSMKKINRHKDKMTNCENVILNSILLSCNNIK